MTTVELETASKNLTASQGWKFGVAVIERTSDRLKLGPAADDAVEAVHAAISALTGEQPKPSEADALTAALTAFDQAIEVDLLAAGVAELRAYEYAEDWSELVYNSLLDRDPAHAVISAEDIDDVAALWSTYVDVTDVPVEHQELWVSLADNWTGTPAELTDAVRAATR